jgi:hypothetical protein
MQGDIRRLSEVARLGEAGCIARLRIDSQLVETSIARTRVGLDRHVCLSAVHQFNWWRRAWPGQGLAWTGTSVFPQCINAPGRGEHGLDEALPAQPGGTGTSVYLQCPSAIIIDKDGIRIALFGTYNRALPPYLAAILALRCRQYVSSQQTGR